MSTQNSNHPGHRKGHQNRPAVPPKDNDGIQNDKRNPTTELARVQNESGVENVSWMKYPSPNPSGPPVRQTGSRTDATKAKPPSSHKWPSMRSHKKLSSAQNSAKPPARIDVRQNSDHLVKEVERLESELEFERSRANNMHLKLEQKQREVIQLKQTQDDIKREFLTLQEHALQRLDTADWKPDSKDDIEGTLHKLDSNVRSWAKEQSNPSLQALLQDEGDKVQKGIVEALLCISSVAEVAALCIPDDKAWLLLHSYIMHRLYSDIFSKPFFGVNERFSTDGTSVTDPNVEVSEVKETSSDSLRAGLETVYAHFSENSERNAFDWRVQTLRQLRPSLQENTVSQSSDISLSKGFPGREKAAKALRKSYLESGIEFLLKEPDSQDVQDTLEGFIVRAASISYSLWTQKACLEVKGLKELGPAYTHGGTDVEAHSLYNKRLNENLTELDGRSILMISHPALIRRGDLDGLDLSTTKILKKAVCWLG